VTLALWCTWAAGTTTATVSVPRWALLVVAGVVGVAVGSFANVVIYRAPRHLSVVHPPSFCPACSTPIRPLDNIPLLSWLVLRGRCRACGEPISGRYPLVEAGTGIAFVLVALASGPHWSVFGLCALTGTLGVSCAIEVDHQMPPRAVSEIGVALGLAGLAASAGVEHHWTRFVGAAAGAFLGAVVTPAARRWAHLVGRLGDERWWIFVPAGAVLGWSGPIGAAVGTGMLCLAVLALPGQRPASASTSNGARKRARTGAAGAATAAAVAAAVALVVAVAAGSPLG